MESFATGTLAGNGSFRCDHCGYVLTLATAETLTVCPSCGGEAFTRASLFTSDVEAAATSAFAPEPAPAEWVDEVRAQLEGVGEYLAYDDGDRTTVVALTREWTRIGRSLAANIRFDDPTVSRRHALLVRAADGMRVLDDRSLNGVFVNGKRVEWSPLEDGDEILVGRHRLHFLVVAEMPAPTGTRASAGG
jgi:predicted  nucleic acid-binding Zn-ribbon protein